jgi:hypothetical protein
MKGWFSGREVGLTQFFLRWKIPRRRGSFRFSDWELRGFYSCSGSISGKAPVTRGEGPATGG